MRILIAAGGTGGHFYPGWSVGEKLRERDWEVLYVVREASASASFLERKDAKVLPVRFRGLDRRRPWSWPLWTLRLAVTLLLACRALRSFKPQAVLGMGGYLSFPFLLAARGRGIPIFLHESNARWGLANRLLYPLCRRAALGLPFARENPARAHLMGTPVRPPFCEKIPAHQARRRLGLDLQQMTLIVFGGSQGAQILNRLLPSILNELQPQVPFQVLHLTGPRWEKETALLYRSSACIRVLGYLEEMHLAYFAADLMISRAGAGTVAELIATRTPALLVPYAAATAGHQRVNAQVLSRIGAAEVFEERLVGTAQFQQSLRGLLLNPQRLGAMRESYSRHLLPDPCCAAERLAKMIEENS
ncbi:MAG: UDP-N-acetylglucosamine--N-acetylmuramyl-(pentapeptide) pyrophosphoryl-undecaprenol N-acetylglucosamine transferase [Elusimicrobia bacterium]|nr:UDP-N-acetylglucosamine--N-acetylmuramyl-(pentapeptide) pyrophosphoryl-undecaprenol N-acetylglucosamine transferase [Elusimicrobiota bacterium]